MKSSLLRPMVILSLMVAFASLLQAQNFKVEDYQYVLNNGIKVHTVEGWDFVYAWPKKIEADTTLAATEGRISFTINAQGNLIAPGTTIQLTGANSSYALTPGKEIKAAPGKYRAEVRAPLQGGVGNISFAVKNISVQPQSVTKIGILLNDVLVMVSASKDNLDGQAIYEFQGEMSKNDRRQDGFTEIAGFFKDFKSREQLEVVDGIYDYKAKVNPGVFALKLEMVPSWADKKIVVWLDNFKFEPDTYYKIMINANGAYLECVRDDRPNLMQFYPVGSAKKLGLHEDKKLELFSFENMGKGRVSPCPIGVYDILLNYGYGERYEWVQNVRFDYGKLTQVK